MKRSNPRPFIPLRDCPGAFAAAQEMAAEGVAAQGAWPPDVKVLLQSHKRHRVLVASAGECARYLGEAGMAFTAPRFARSFHLPVRDVYLVVYNPALGAASLRYALAHELGHIVLEHMLELPTATCHVPYGRQEREADAFACSLLAPPVLIDYLYGQAPYSAARVAAYFGVPQAAARRGIRNNYLYWCLKKMLSIQELGLVRGFVEVLPASRVDPQAKADKQQG